MSSDPDDVKKFYDRDADTYDEQRFSTEAGDRNDTVQQSIVHRCLDTLPRDATVLELGCGTGRFTSLATEAGFEVVATDISAEMLGQARNAVDSDAEGEFVQADVTNLPYAAGTFDAAIMINVLSHLPDPEEAFEEVGRVLEPDGQFVFNYPQLRSVYYPVGKYVNRDNRSIHGDVYTRWYTRAEIAQFLGLGGLNASERIGHVHVPTRDIRVINTVLGHLDGLARSSSLRRVAPVEFVVARGLSPD